MSEYVITIPGWHPISGNQQLRSHWGVNKKKRDETQALVWGYANQLNIPLANGKKRSVAIHLNKTTTGKKDDPANIDSRSKHILDALTQLGILTDDDSKHLDWQGVTDSIGHSHKSTIITIEDVIS